MEIRTENLTILFVDIAGFTATTSRQSRAENAKLLQTFNSTLLPIIKRFKGLVVKSIGDALLLTFRSPTDAMLCAMALQDAMHAHNLNAQDDEKIHIRVAANLGEVRITKKDIFGEPVNVASRIEGVTPADEIYLSEAVYMAMNKAEVPAQEAGQFELAGVSGALRLYCIPRFATTRLIPQQLSPQEQGDELLFPYGGMHQRSPDAKRVQLTPSSTPIWKGLAFGLLSLTAIAALYFVWPLLRTQSEKPVEHSAPVATEPSQTVTPELAKKTVSPAPIEAATSLPTMVAVDADEKVSAAHQPKTQVVAPTVNKTVEQKVQANSPIVAEPVTKTAAQATEKPALKPVVAIAPAPPPSVVVDEFSAPWNIAKLKRAYRAGKITKPEYKKIAQQLEDDYDNTIRQLKLAYRAKQINKVQYEQSVREAKRSYSGNP